MGSKSATVPRFPEQGARAFFRWEIPDEAIEVDLHLNVIELLERDATWAGRRISAGVLLGSVTRGRKLTLAIEHYERATPERGASESPFGNSQLVETMMSRWNPGKSRMALLGFYRTCAPGKLNLTTSDLSAAATNFKEAASPSIASAKGSAHGAEKNIASDDGDIDGEELERVFLLIEPAGGRSFNGVVFLTRGTTVAWQSEPIPLNRAELAKKRAPGGPQAAERGGNRGPAVAPQEVQAANERSEQGYDPNGKASKKMTPLHWAAIAVSTALVLVGAYIQFTGKHVADPAAAFRTGSSDTDLGLKLGASGSSWQLSWNGNAPAIVNATKGKLLVTDGSNQKEIDLDQASLRGGTLVYTPTGGDVVLQLEVDGDDASDAVRESVRIVGGSSPTMVPSTVASSDPQTQLPSTFPLQGQGVSMPANASDFQQPVNLPANVVAPVAVAQPMAPIAPLPAPVVPARAAATQTIARPYLPEAVPPHDAPLKTAVTEHAAISHINDSPLKMAATPVPSTPRMAGPENTTRNSIVLKVSAPRGTSSAAVTTHNTKMTSAAVAAVRPQVKMKPQPAFSQATPDRMIERVPQESLALYAVKAGPNSNGAISQPKEGIREAGSSEAGVEEIALQPVRHADTAQPAQLISRVEPVYPPGAKELHLAGSVEVAFKIAADGTVRDVAVKSGPRQLASTAADAVSEWRYKPALLNGVPTETMGSAVFVFKAN